MDPQFMFSHRQRHEFTRPGDSIEISGNNITLEDDNANDNLENLYPALVECFGIILLGYIAGKFSLINDVEAKGRTFNFVGPFLTHKYTVRVVTLTWYLLLTWYLTVGNYSDL